MRPVSHLRTIIQSVGLQNQARDRPFDGPDRCLRHAQPVGGQEMCLGGDNPDRRIEISPIGTGETVSPASQVNVRPFTSSNELEADMIIAVLRSDVDKHCLAK